MSLSGRSREITLPTCCLPNRVTLLAVAEPETGGLHIRQLMLAPAQLRLALPDIVQERMGHGDLQIVKFIADSQSLFARGESLQQDDQPRGPDLWTKLLNGKWLDPMLAIVAGYALAREGRFDDANIVIRNLRMYFSGLPDTEALAKIAGLPFQRPDSPPLVLDGLQAFEDYETLWPNPIGTLDFNGPWTMWRGTRTG